VSDSTNGGLTRRDMIKTTGKIAVASALAGVAIPHVHAAGSDVIQLALVGCGGRGTGAAENAMRVQTGPTKLVAMADVFEERLENSHKNLHKDFAKQMEVPKDRRFLGFDAYKHAMDCLKPGDVVMLTTPPAFRWVHFTYAIQKGLNVFMEKPVAVDGPAARKMLKLAKEAEAKNLKVGVGLMCRHCAVRQELFDRIRSGQIGDIVLLRAYRQQGQEAKEFAPRRSNDVSELLHQIKWFHSFLWASGGCYSDFLIHHIDECCWMKNDWPIRAQASGGREYNNNHYDQNFDHYSVEYTFADGAKLYLEGRNIPGCYNDFASYAHGTKAAAVISQGGHSPAHCRIMKGQNITRRRDELAWAGPKDEPNPYQLEWEDLTRAIREGKPYNEVERGTMASLVTAMGRMAAHTGQVITQEQMLHCENEFAPQVAELTYEHSAPIQSDKDGKYPVPEPGRKTKREF
jgi:predicted dehydrogenase